MKLITGKIEMNKDYKEVIKTTSIIDELESRIDASDHLAFKAYKEAKQCFEIMIGLIALQVVELVALLYCTCL